MKAERLFLQQPLEFWAYIRTISQAAGYTDRNTKQVMVPSVSQVQAIFARLNLSLSAVQNKDGNLTQFGQTLFSYFKYRSQVLHSFVESQLMNRGEAEALFQQLYDDLQPRCPLPMNKQKGDKRNYAFLTCIVNMILEKELGRMRCDFDPRQLTTVTHNNMPLRTLSRRVDGAFPSVIDPIAIWEIKEYYYTTTFGSRIADGVYETLLDGMELEELELQYRRKINHLLIIDDYSTWWQQGRSYLCRIIDMLHMGLVDEVIFGKEVIDTLPILVQEWKQQVKITS